MHIQVRNNGFTLIELSIVLVIIGLVTGGVLFGRDLIRAAQVRAQITQLERLDTAVNTFRLKYGCLPGDCDSAESQGLGTAANPGANGDGNGIIDVDIILTVHYNLSTPEPANFWYHLARAGLIEGQYRGYNGSLLVPGKHTPALKLPGYGVVSDVWTGPNSDNSVGGLCVFYPTQVIDHNSDPVFNFGTKHTVMLGSRCDGYPAGIYFGNDIYALDAKMDDGLPKTGKVQGFMYSLLTWDMFESFVPTGGCIKTGAGGKTYDRTVVSGAGYTPFCTALIQMNF